jgi:cytochrome c oxidase cbb3-type subunit 3
MPRRDRRAATAVLGALAWALTACSRETRSFGNPDTNRAGVRVDDDAGASMQPGPDPFGQNAWAMGQGGRLFEQMNCSGCHFHGGGGMGPPLMDGKWIYGEDDASIFTSIVEGRPNGMPAFRGRLGDDQVWQLVSYVKSLGGNASSFSASARDDHMNVRPGPARTDPQPITKDEP